MYLIIANSVYKSESEIFKKHFAKSIATEMVEEKVKVVQITMTKLVMQIPAG